MFLHNRKKTRFIILAAAVALASIGLMYGVYCVILKDTKHFGTRDNQDAIGAESQEQRRQLEKDINSNPISAVNPSPASKEAIVNTPRPELAVEIKSIEQKNHQLYFSIVIHDKPESGKCIIRIEQDGKPRVERFFDLKNNNCNYETLDIRDGQSGSWTATVIITSNRTVASDVKTVMLD